MSDIIVKFYEINEIADELLKYAVIAAKYNGKWVFCRHKQRNTYEIPGGRREIGENIDIAAKRELFEETGAVRYKLSPVYVYSVTKSDQTDFGKLYFAEIFRTWFNTFRI